MSKMLRYGDCDEIIGKILWSALPFRLNLSTDDKRLNLQCERTSAIELAVLVRFAHLVDGVQLKALCRD
jgi:hypothetical protein